MALGRRIALAALTALAIGGLNPTVAAAQAPVEPWDGAIRFNCELQDVGTETDFPHPQADPFCVEFDKTQQNITELGIVDFLLNEPARVAAAVPKCFYHQRDHWTGSVVQGEPPELWNWDGNYFFDKARGEGGVRLDNLRIAGQPVDATPFVPDEFKPFLSPGGGGGGRIVNDIPVDPTCAARVDSPEEQAQVYFHCLDPDGPTQAQGLAGVTIGETRDEVLTGTGPPHGKQGFTDRWCAEDEGQIRIGFPKRNFGPDSIVRLLWSSNPENTRGGVGPGDSRADAVAALGLRHKGTVDGLSVWATRRFSAGARVFIGAEGGVVRYLALATHGISWATASNTLDRAGD
jgi:hypothetical protein